MVWNFKKKYQPLKIAQELSRSNFLVLHKINVMHLRSVKGTGGGPEKTILLSGEKIDKERFDMIIVYLKGIRDKTFGVTEKAKGFNVNYFEIAEKGKFDLNTIKKLKRLIREYRIDILHTHDYKSDFYAWVLSKMCDIKLMATVHGWINNDPKERFYNWLDKRVIRYYDKVIAVSEAMGRYLLDIGIPSQKQVTISNAIDVEDFKKNGLFDIRQELNLNNRQIPIVGAIGRLSKEKDLKILFLAAQKVLSQNKKVKFLIVGDGPERNNLEGLANKLKIKDSIIFLGQREDIKRIYETIDLLVSISTTEGLPNTILEALSMEVPVMTTEVGGVGEIISNNVNGLLFQPGDVTGIAEGINRLLSDSVLASSFSREGRKLVCEKFSFDERMRKIEKVYSEIMGDKVI